MRKLLTFSSTKSKYLGMEIEEFTNTSANISVFKDHEDHLHRFIRIQIQQTQQYVEKHTKSKFSMFEHFFVHLVWNVSERYSQAQ